MGTFSPFIVTGLAVGAIYALSGVGLVVLYRASGVLNFAYGALGAVGALLAWQLIDGGYPEPLAWLAALLLSALLAFVYGRFLAPQLANRGSVVKAIATLGYALVILGSSEWIWGDTPRRLGLLTDSLGFTVGSVRITATRAIAFVLATLITVGITVFLNRTQVGLRMRALANNRQLSAIIGIRVLTVESWVWVISGLLAGLSGLMLGSLVRLDARVLTFLVIPAMAAAVIGKLRSLYFTLFGGLLIGLIEALATPFAAIAPFRSMAPFVVAIIALIWMQRGRTLTFAGDD